MTSVSLVHVTKQYSPGQKGVDDLSLEIPGGKITALLGPSGGGKTTCLKMIAGLISPTGGDIRFDDESVLSLPAERRGAVMVFQNQGLFPFLTVGENVGFGLKMRGVAPAQIRREVSRMLDRVELPGLQDRMPIQLSGGQQQRAALARALIVEPRVLLLDEPFSSLDARLRDEMRELVRNLQRQRGTTTRVVTHDREDAVILADRIAVLFQGVLQQVDIPRSFYERPASVRVAAFFGARNILPGELTGAGVQTALGVLRVHRDGLRSGAVDLVIRAENVQVADSGCELDNCIDGRVDACVYAGTHIRLHVRSGETTLEADIQPAGQCYGQGERVRLHLPADKLWMIPRLPEPSGESV